MKSAITDILYKLLTKMIFRERMRREQIEKQEHEMNLERERYRLKLEEEERKILRKNIEKLSDLLSFFQNRISLSESIATASAGLSFEAFEADFYVQYERITASCNLLSIAFPEFKDKLARLRGLYHQYWGNQSLLLRVNEKSREHLYAKIISIEGQVNKEIREIHYKLEKMVLPRLRITL